MLLVACWTTRLLQAWQNTPVVQLTGEPSQPPNSMFQLARSSLYVRRCRCVPESSGSAESQRWLDSRHGDCGTWSSAHLLRRRCRLKVHRGARSLLLRRYQARHWHATWWTAASETRTWTRYEICVSQATSVVARLFSVQFYTNCALLNKIIQKLNVAVVEKQKFLTSRELRHPDSLARALPLYPEGHPPPPPDSLYYALCSSTRFFLKALH